MQFKDIPGHESLKQKLAKSVVERRIHHTQLFLENPGSPGLSLALAYAQHANCENPSPTDSCAQCNACLKAQKLIHPDIHFTYPTVTRKSGEKPISADYIKEWREAILTNPYLELIDWMRHINAETKQGNITVRECREIIKNFNLKTIEAKYKIQIIWMPEALGKEGNTLLKLLEEPPKNSLFLLIANNEERILNTILSRTQILRIPSFQDEAISKYLEEEFQLPSEKAKSLSLLADGNLNRALALASDNTAETGELLKQWFGFITRDRSGLSKFVDKLAGSGKENLKNLMLQGSHLCRESLILQTTNLPGRLPTEEHKIAVWLAKNINFTAINAMASFFEDAIYHFERNANSKLQLMDISLKIQDVLAQRVSA